MNVSQNRRDLGINTLASGSEVSKPDATNHLSTLRKFISTDVVELALELAQAAP